MADHGTTAGFWRHRYLKESPCDTCRLAWNAYNLAKRPGVTRASCAGGRGKPVRKSSHGKPTKCRACFAAPKFTQHQREARAKLRKAARGKAAPKNWAWCVGMCANCSEPFARKGTPSSYCSRRCNHRARSNFVSDIVRLAIYERDGWTCQLCSDPVDSELYWSDNWAASLDHIVCRSKGGSDDPSNLRLAHRWCNSVRGDETYYSAEILAA